MRRAVGRPAATRGGRSVRVSAGRLSLAALLSLGLAFPLAPVAAAQAAADAALAETRQRFARMGELLDPSGFDVDALALELAFEEPDDIAAWVDDNVRYEAYDGVLRGPTGTLVAGAGNALDQAVLLARLLGDAGFDARVALGTLGEEDAGRLVMSMFDDLAASAGPVEADHDADANLTELAAIAGVDRGVLSAGVSKLAGAELQDLDEFHEALAQTQAILAEVERQDGRAAVAVLMDDASRYAWVEYRLSAADAWRVAHPAWPGGTPPDLVAESVLEGQVPEELTHRLRIEVTVERKRGDAFETQPLMTPWERPVAELLGRTIVIGNTALGETGQEDIATMGADMVESAFFAPVLNGGLAPGAMAFDLAGNLVPPDAAASAMAGVFQTVGERVGGAAGAIGALGGDEAPKEPFALTAQWIDFVLVGPGGHETRHRRTVFDRRAPGSREADTDELLDESVLKDGLITTYAVMATGGSVSQAFVASQLLEQASFHLAVLEGLAATAGSVSADDRASVLLEALADYVPKDHLALLAASDAVDSVLRGVAYRAEPSLVALVGAITPDEEVSARSGVDIIANAKRTFHVVEGEVVVDFEGGVLAGVWDTVVEREFVESYGGEPVNAMAEGREVGLEAVYSAAPHDLIAAGVPDEALTAVLADMGNGYAALVPTRAEPSAARWTYWRIDPVTGESLGMDAGGRGNAMTEFIVSLKVGLVVNAALAVPSLIQCASSGQSWLCYCDVIASGVAFSFLGALIGALFTAQAAVAAYVIVDTAIVAPIATMYTPPMCSGYASRPGGGSLAADPGGTTCPVA